MWPKQLSFYRLDADFIANLTAEALHEALTQKPFAPCTGLDWSREGWIAPAKHVDGMVMSIKGAHLVKLKREDKVLPAGVIRDALDAKVQDIEDKELRKVGRKEKTALKEQITDDLLPKSHTKSSALQAWVDASGGWLMIDSGTASRAETLIGELRDALPPFPAALPRTVTAPHSAMTDWLLAGEAPGGFELDDIAELRAQGEEGAIVRVKRQDLTADEMQRHLQGGKQAHQLGLVWRERIRFVLTDTLQLKRLQFLDVLQEEASQAGDDPATLAEATLLLMSAELRELVTELVESLGGLQHAD